MVDTQTVQEQLKRLGFGSSVWNAAELRELPHILHSGEEILELVNGFYEGGVALLVATDMRVLLIDKKPLNYLNIEDLRFDMINEIDYNHRLFGAAIAITTGSKSLNFRSFNKLRLRKLITLVQERMSTIKKEQSEKAETQQQHLEEINKQLQMYLLAQHQQLQQQLAAQTNPPAVELPRPDPKLADYLFAQRLLEDFRKQHGDLPAQVHAAREEANGVAIKNDLFESGRAEIFGDTSPKPTQKAEPSVEHDPWYTASLQTLQQLATRGAAEVSPLVIAGAKLPMMLRRRKFGGGDSSQEATPTSRITGNPVFPAP